MNKNKEYSAVIIKQLSVKDGKNILEFVGGCIVLYGGYYVWQAGMNVINLMTWCRTVQDSMYMNCITDISEKTFVPGFLCMVCTVVLGSIGLYLCYNAIKTYPKQRVLVKIEKEQKRELM